MPLSVTDACKKRFSCRKYLDTPVDGALVREILEKASRAASDGNTQPWKVYVLSGEGKTYFCSQLREAMQGKTHGARAIHPASYVLPLPPRSCSAAAVAVPQA